MMLLSFPPQPELLEITEEKPEMKYDKLQPADPMFGVSLGVIPFDRSYLVTPRLLAGVYPASGKPAEATERLGRLLTVGVNHVVNLTEPTEKNWQHIALVDYEPGLTKLAAAKQKTVVCRRFPIRDLDVPSVTAMRAILDDIDEGIEAKRKLYVHCWGGRGRTGTVVGCYLARHGMAVGEEALQLVRYLRRTDAKAGTEAPETPEQKAFVRRWKPGE